MSTQPQSKPVEPPPAASPHVAAHVAPVVARVEARIGAFGDAPPAVRRRRGRWIAFAAAAILLAAAAAAAWQVWRDGAAASNQFATTPVERGDIEDATTAVGTVQPLEYVDVGTQVSGNLRKVHVQIGDAVSEKDLLAEIEPTVYLAKVEAGRAQLLNLNAQLADKQSQFDLARQQFDRQTNLLRANATSEEAYQTSKATLGSATAQVAALKAQIQNTESTLKADEANLSYTKIRAPMAGTVVSQTAKQGQTLNANQQAPIILRIADLSTMTVWSQVSEADIGRLKIGMDVYFTTLGQPDRKWRGKLRQILPTPEILNNVVLYDALFDVPNSTGELLPQMTVQAFFVLASVKDALVVPVAALKPIERSAARTRGPRRGEGDAAPAGRTRFQVQVLRDDGTVEDRDVEVGLVTRVSAQIVDGLREGERVVLGAKNPNARPNVPGFARSPRLS